MANEISLDPIVVLALAKKYTEETAKGGGAIAGKNIIVKGKANVTDAEGHITGVNLTVGYTLNDGTEKEEVLFLPAGPKGEQGEQGEKGEDGTPGQDGQKGSDGVSPSISVTPITGGHRVTITDATHDAGNPLTFDVMDGRDGSGAGGDAVLSDVLKASKTVGGIPSGKEYTKNTPLEKLFRDMLNPVENPQLTPPSATISASGGVLVEEGETATKTLTIAFNRGKIDPAYGTSGNRAGAATGYSINGGESQTGNTFSVTVDDSNKTFTGKVDYAAGEQPKNSAGENYGEPLAAGSVNTNTLTFEIVAAIWSNAANIAQIAKEALISRNTKQKQFNFPAQTAANPEIFDVRSTWSVTAVELLNTLNNQWVNCASEFTITDVTHDGLAFKRYTYNGGDATGARSVRIKWS